MQVGMVKVNIYTNNCVRTRANMIFQGPNGGVEGAAR